MPVARYLLLIAVQTALSLIAAGEIMAMGIEAREKGLTLHGDGIECGVDALGQLHLSRGQLSYVLSGFNARSNPDGFAGIAQLLSTQVLEDGQDRKAGRAEFALADGAHLIVDLQVRAGLPCVFIFSHLANLGDGALDRDRWPWYHWTWPHHADEFITSGEDGLSTRKMAENGPIAFSDWAFIANRDGTGGLGLITRHRLSSDRTSALIWAQNRVLHAALMPAAGADEVTAVFGRIGGLAALPEVPTIAWAPRPQEYYGAPAPDWLRAAEVCSFLYPDWAERTDLQTAHNFPLLLFADRIQWPVDGAPTGFIERAHEAGMRVIPYVCFSELSDLSKASDRGYYNALFDIEHHADDWACFNAEGQYIVSPWGVSTKQPHLYAMCMNSQGYFERVLAVVKTLMDGGADGLFIDNVGSWAASTCSGDNLGKHAHVEPQTPPTTMYKRLLQEVYDLVKSYGPDRIVMHNGGMDWRSCDVKMTEGFLDPSSGHMPHASPEQVLAIVEPFEEAWQHGKVCVALTYTAATTNHREADFYSYAAAKLAGCLWTSWFSPRMKDPGAFPTLYQLRLGKPLGEIIREENVLFRYYERGAVVLNTGDAEAELKLAVEAAVLSDIHASEPMQPTDGVFTARVPAHSGRVYAAGAATAGE